MKYFLLKVFSPQFDWKLTSILVACKLPVGLLHMTLSNAKHSTLPTRTKYIRSNRHWYVLFTTDSSEVATGSSLLICIPDTCVLALEHLAAMPLIHTYLYRYIHIYIAVCGRYFFICCGIFELNIVIYTILYIVFPLCFKVIFKI